jgi:SAM-dependent methyltransferase
MRNLNKAYTSREILNYYSLNRNKWFDFYKSERKIISKLKIKKNSNILDIGSACGGLGEVLRKRYKVKNYTGIEINKKAYDYAKIKNKEFIFINSDLLNYEKNIKNNSKFNYVFSLGCVDWNFELDKMLKKSWKHVKEKGYLVITLRLTNIPKFKKSYQFINFSKKKRGEKASYQVLYIENLLKKLSKLNISKILYYGYWGKPNLTVVTKHKKVFFVAMALQKNLTNKNIIKFNKFKKNFFK